MGNLAFREHSGLRGTEKLEGVEPQKNGGSVLVTGGIFNLGNVCVLQMKDHLDVIR